MIEWLRAVKLGQKVRSEGPQTHLAKDALKRAHESRFPFDVAKLMSQQGLLGITIPEAGAEYLRGLPEDADGHLDAAGVLWIGGDGYATSRA